VGQGIQIETGDGQLRTIVFGWGAVALGIGIAVAAVVLSAWLGWAFTIISAGLGVGLAAVGVGEGVRRARIGDAARIAASRGELPAHERKELPEWTRR
jgi:hypothetical protein